MLKHVCKHKKTPTCFGPFYSTILSGPYAVLCAVTIMSSADLRLLSICLVCGHMCISSICVCVCVCVCAWCSY
jgi:hypothetical protein